MKTFSLLALLLSLALAGSAAAQTKKERNEAKRIVEAADKAFKAKNYQAAIDGYARAIELVPNQPYAHYWKGYAHYYLQQNDVALGELNTALQQGYKAADIYKIRWYLNYQAKNYDAAFQDVSGALKENPGDVEMLVALGDVNFVLGRYQDALEAYQKAQQKLPNNGDIYFHVAKSQAAAGNWAGSISAAESAIKLRTRYLGESLFIVATAYQQQKQNDQALAAYEKALAAKADIHDAYRNMAEIYRQQGRFADAINISQKGLSLYPQDPDIYTDLSWFYSLSDRHDDAIQSALAAIKIDNTRPMAYTNLCRAYNDLRKPELAVTACNNALKIKPDDGETLFYLARAYDLAGRRGDATLSYKKAVAGLEKFTADNLDYSDGFYLLGNAYFADNQRQKAIAAYQRCLDLSPRFARARYNIGIIQVLEKNKPAAMEQYTSLLTIDRSLAGKLKAEIDKL
jgi:tetratricopeptide (TPR) repeat protein